MKIKNVKEMIINAASATIATKAGLEVNQRTDGGIKGLAASTVTVGATFVIAKDILGMASNAAENLILKIKSQNGMSNVDEQDDFEDDEFFEDDLDVPVTEEHESETTVKDVSSEASEQQQEKFKGEVANEIVETKNEEVK